MINCKEHLNINGLKKIIAIKASINKGLNDELKAEFADTIPISKPQFEISDLIDPNWISGFSTGEACFFILIGASPNSKLKKRVKLEFSLVQHIRDEQLMRSLIEFLGCGYLLKNRKTIQYRVTKFSDISEKIISIFCKHSILGVKSLDFSDFCRAVKLMKEKKHHLSEGLGQISNIKANMNKGRNNT
jgi:hypothetical protein